MQSERGFERLCSIRKTATGKMDPFVLAECFNDPGNARFFLCINDDDRSSTSRASEIREGGGKKETGETRKLANFGRDSAIQAEMPHPFMLVCTK